MKIKTGKIKRGAEMNSRGGQSREAMFKMGRGRGRGMKERDNLQTAGSIVAAVCSARTV